MTRIRKASANKEVPQALQAIAASIPRKVTLDVDARRKRSRTLAKQQQASERVAAASGELSSGINQAASAAEELKQAAAQIATSAEEALGAAHAGDGWLCADGRDPCTRAEPSTP